MIKGIFESSSDFHHQEEGSLGDGLLYIGPSAIINVGDDLILNGYGQTLMDNASCGNGSAVDDIYFVGEQARICGNGRFIVPNDIRFWLDNGQELTNESAINEQVATQMCRGFTLYGSSEDCSAGTPKITGNADSTFPVEWVDFSAVQKGGRTELSWTIGSELNNDYFVIEKSIENQEFVEIARVEGVGNSTESNTYKFSDLQLTENVVYYRIKQVDIDGAFSYSEVLSLRLKATSFTFGVFPNPSQGDVINIEMSRIDPSPEVEISLMDMQGRAIYTENRTDLSSRTMQLNLPRLRPGLYRLKVKHGGDSGIKRLVIK